MTGNDPHADPAEPPGNLTAMLRAGASGHVPTEAAIDLLIGHGVWPQRLHRQRHVDTWPATQGHSAMAAIDWRTVADRIGGPTEHGFAASSSEHTILAVATSRTGRLTVCLGDVLPRLDATNAGLVATAIAHACNSGVHVTIHRPRPANAFDDLGATRRQATISSDASRNGRVRP